MAPARHNFGFLAAYEPLLERLAGLAELYAHQDPNTALLKLRQFGEALAQQVAARAGIDADPGENQVELLRELEARRILTRDVANLLHRIRVAGNDAAHGFTGTVGDVIHLLKLARELGVWFVRTFGANPSFSPGAWVRPVPPADASTELRQQLEELRRELASHQARADDVTLAAQREAERAREAAAQAMALQSERDVALQLAEEVEALLARERADQATELARLRAVAAAAGEPARRQLVDRAAAAAAGMELSEADTRKLIDAQLREAGWEANSEMIRWTAGARPTKGRSLAIAEWPTAAGPADYVLFVGLTPVAIVEAKRQAKNVPGCIEQAKRYSEGYVVKADESLSGGPWGTYRVPFLFATNGRQYLRQIADASGIWFLDARRATNHPRPLEGWYSPEGLSALLQQDVDAAERALRESSADYLPLRDYQRDAIDAVEAELERGRRSMLVAMATGTGKTRMLICLIYRLLKARRFRRVLFLVDRGALGEQTADALKDVRLENLQSFTDIYDVKELGDVRPDADTRLHVATVQGMVRRILFPAPGEPEPAVDAYDCVVVDECHRGYTLDREMSDAELTFRSQADYVSKYRRVLDHFDAVKIGVTATPALHTTEIFGPPVYSYSYRQAVIDGWLVDHEPPVRIATRLSEDGIHWASGERVAVYDVRRGQVDAFQAPDEIDIEVEDFNRRVVTENFNRVVCRYLATEIDPDSAGKTLVFCVNDQHADMVVRLLKEAFADRYGEVRDDAVLKITGAADQPLQLLRLYKNERMPSVAVTVDLLTTGVDVPAITTLVFLRRVKSRILYEQMLGRATRLRPGLYGEGEDKEVFRIFDAVDLYSALEPHTAMPAVVPNSEITFAQLVAELVTLPDGEGRATVLEQLVAKLQRRRAKLERHVGDQVESASGERPRGLVERLRRMTPAEAAGFLDERPALVSLLDRAYRGEHRLLISDHEDELRAVTHGYGNGKRPEDYLEGFERYLRTHINEVPALLAVTQRPRDLTRKQLRELMLALDAAGYSEVAIQTAWRDVHNEDVAATIIGFIRRMALGSPLKPYAERVQLAKQRILAAQRWSDPQRKWLERICRQLEREVVVDREAMDREQFRAQGGGYDRLNKVFDGRLDTILGDLQDALWLESA